VEKVDAIKKHHGAPFVKLKLENDVCLPLYRIIEEKDMAPFVLSDSITVPALGPCATARLGRKAAA
jgi:hypothetical protein